MDILVKYIDYHADNYQGGSGQTFNFEKLVSVSDSILACEVADRVLAIIEEVAKEQRPHNQNVYEKGLVIQEMRIL